MSVRISLRIQPGAKKETLEKSSQGWKLKISAPPIDGRANERVREILAQIFGLSPSRIKLVKGEKSKNKAFEIEKEMSADELDEIFTHAQWK